MSSEHFEDEDFKCTDNRTRILMDGPRLLVFWSTRSYFRFQHDDGCHSKGKLRKNKLIKDLKKVRKIYVFGSQGKVTYHVNMKMEDGSNLLLILIMYIV